MVCRKKCCYDVCGRNIGESVQEGCNIYSSRYWDRGRLALATGKGFPRMRQTKGSMQGKLGQSALAINTCDKYVPPPPFVCLDAAKAKAEGRACSPSPSCWDAHNIYITDRISWYILFLLDLNPWLDVLFDYCKNGGKFQGFRRASIFSTVQAHPWKKKAHATRAR